MRIWKLQALGNNFVFVLHEDGVDHPALAERLCRRDVSVGADGLLSLDLAVAPPMVRMWNPDGTADFCGNGLCCAALLAYHLRGQAVALLQTPDVRVPVRLEPIEAGVARVAIRIPRPTFDPARIPLAVEHAVATARGWRIAAGDQAFELIACSNGNMHSAILCDALPDEATFARYSPLIETHPLFPHRTNLLWCVVEGAALRVRIWERAVGETAACGTGAAAAVAICRHAGHRLPPVVAVRMPGGTAQVGESPHDMEFASQATLVFAGDLIAGA